MRTFFALITLIFFTLTSYSQQVTPVEDVVNHVNVRASNSAGSPVIDSLFPGESMEFIESVPYWYKVRCAGGAIGYVSKRWTKIDAFESEAEDKDYLVIGSWNIKNFASCSRDTLYYTALADIIQQFDVLALQELSSNLCTRHLDSIVNELHSRGLKYFYTYSEKTGYWDNPDPAKGNYRERLGFFWDIDRVELLHPDEPYSFISEPYVNNDIFRQVPIVCDFRVKRTNGFDFRAVSVHAAFNKKIPYVRQAEFHYLDDWMIEQLNNPGITEKDLFIMGDLNANPKDQPNAHYFDTIIGNAVDYRVIFYEPKLANEHSITTTIHFPTTTNPGDTTLPVYDHILLSKRTDFDIPDTLTWSSDLIGVIKFDQEPRWQQAGKNITVKALSDHRPVWIRIPYNTADRD